MNLFYQIVSFIKQKGISFSFRFYGFKKKEDEVTFQVAVKPVKSKILPYPIDWDKLNFQKHIDVQYIINHHSQTIDNTKYRNYKHKKILVIVYLNLCIVCNLEFVYCNLRKSINILYEEDENGRIFN